MTPEERRRNLEAAIRAAREAKDAKTLAQLVDLYCATYRGPEHYARLLEGLRG